VLEGEVLLHGHDLKALPVDREPFPVEATVLPSLVMTACRVVEATVLPTVVITVLPTVVMTA
jgi:hypothetical protein